MSKKVVLKLEVLDEKGKHKAMKAVSSLTGIESLAMDMNEKKLTVIGNVDPVQIGGKLRKYWCTEILSVGPAKEPEKKEDGKKEDGKKDDGKKDDGKKDDGNGNEPECCCRRYTECYCRVYTECYCRGYTECYYDYSCEENPSSCVIC